VCSPLAGHRNRPGLRTITARARGWAGEHPDPARPRGTLRDGDPRRDRGPGPARTL